MQKRDHKIKEYKEYIISEDRHCPLRTDMNEDVNCASCGQVQRFGNLYTSRIIHNDIWLWYGVCNECYCKEEK